MVLLANSIAPWWCFACMVCGGAPDWPDQGVATRDWVVEALEWRLDRGIGDCEEYMPAIDAWTLEWIGNSTEIRVEIVTENWPVFTYEPLLQGPLIQIIALESLNGNEFNKKKTLRKLKKFARRSDEIWDEELIQKFKETKEIK
jgi:hypothetical protein